jgi:hypothetical protein
VQPNPSTGWWEFSRAVSEDLPGAVCAAENPQGNYPENTLVIWYDYEDSACFEREIVPFYGKCSSCTDCECSGGSGGGGDPMPLPARRQTF